MRKRARIVVVAVLAGVLLITSAAGAFALTDEAADDNPTIDLETLKENVLARISERIQWFEDRIADLEGAEGVAPEQRVALFADGIAIFEQLADDVEAATTVDEVIQLSKAARQEYRAHRRVRAFYVHVQRDIDKFTRRLARLEGAIDRATEAGFDTSAAVAEAEVAAADLATAQALLDAIDPSMTGEEVVEALKEAHRTAHSGQAHIRAGWAELREVLGPAEAA